MQVILVTRDGKEHAYEVPDASATAGALVSVYCFGAKVRVFRFTPTPGSLRRFEETEIVFIDNETLPKSGIE